MGKRKWEGVEALNPLELTSERSYYLTWTRLSVLRTFSSDVHDCKEHWFLLALVEHGEEAEGRLKRTRKVEKDEEGGGGQGR